MDLHVHLHVCTGCQSPHQKEDRSSHPKGHNLPSPTRNTTNYSPHIENLASLLHVHCVSCLSSACTCTCTWSMRDWLEFTRSGTVLTNSLCSVRSSIQLGRSYRRWLNSRKCSDIFRYVHREMEMTTVA